MSALGGGSGADRPVGSPVDAYLDDLLARLSARHPREARRLLAEAEEHLRDATEAGLVDGLSLRAAETRAVARFGPASEVAAAERARLATPLIVLVRQTFASAWLLGAVGAVAVGASGLVAAGIRLVAGERALVDVAPGQVLSASDCSRWLGLRPGVGSCRAAAVADWADETIFYRLALGALGVLALAGYRWLARRTGRRPGLAPVVSETIAATLFTASAAWTTALGVDAIVVNSSGWGQWFSAAVVAAAAAVVFGVRVLRELRSGVVAKA